MQREEIKKAQESLRAYLRPTPLIWCEGLSRVVGQEVWLKLENLQPTGSFKVRPAFYGILQALEESRQRGVLTSSSGNFAQAVGYAAQKLGVSAKIVMRKDTAPLKLQRTAAWGAEIALCENTQAARFAMTKALYEAEGRHLLHPFDSQETIAADGTIGLEIEEALGTEISVLVPVSGGGLVSGIAAALASSRLGSRVFGVQSNVNASFLRSLQEGRPVEVPAFSSLADALIATIPGHRAFSISKDLVAGGFLVSEASSSRAVRWLLEEARLLVEPGGAVGVAALLEGQRPPSPAPIVCVISGGNLDPSRLALWLQEAAS